MKPNTPITNKKNGKIITLFSLSVALLLGLSSCRKYHDCGSDMGNAATPATGNWTKVASLPSNQEFTLLETSGNNIYAASGAGIVYTSNDMGATWSASVVVKQGAVISALGVLNNIIYAGTQLDGIFASSNGGQSWTKQSSVAQINSFTIFNNNLYASSSQGTSPGDGICVLDQQAGIWGQINSNGLPSNYDFDAVKTIAVNQSLVSIRGGNGFLYTINSVSGWSQVSYFNPHRLATMRDIVYAQGTMLVTPGTMLYGSNDLGATWAADTLGLQKEPGTVNSTNIRILYAANNQLYVVSNILTGGGVNVQQRDATVPVGTSWATHSDILPAPIFAYAIRSLNNTLFLATDNGLYYRKN